MVHKVIIVSVRVLWEGGRVYTGICRLQAWKSFPVGGGGGGPQSDYSVCPRPLGRG